MGKRIDVEGKSRGESVSAVRAVREVIQADGDLDQLSPEETALLTSQLTNLLTRVERVRDLGPAYAGVDVSPDVQELLTRLEAGSSLLTGVH